LVEHDEMSILGFKKLTRENWLEPESMMDAFVHVSRTDQMKVPISPDEWVDRFLKPQLDSEVPIEIVRLFEVARGSVAYGYFFYPLYTLAGEQLYRIAEAAVSARSQMVGTLPRAARTFRGQLNFLREKNIVSDQDCAWWDVARELRNYVSHPRNQSILMPFDVLRDLYEVSIRINRLFAVSQT
jgi:hypothetical protein